MSPTDQQRLLRLSWGFAAATILSNITWVLTHGSTRDALTIAGVALFFSASLTHSLARYGVRWSVVFFAIACTFGWSVEAVGTLTGFPFGEYLYADRLGPSLGSVPLVIPLAWAMMSYPCFVMAQASVRSTVSRVVLGAALLASWDLFLDPQMVSEGHWRWADSRQHVPGIPDIPVTNFLGWIFAALLLMTLLIFCDRIPRESSTLAQVSLRQPLLLLTWVYLSSVLANAVFFDRPSVALIGGFMMGIPMAFVWLLENQSRPSRENAPAHYG